MSGDKIVAGKGWQQGDNRWVSTFHHLFGPKQSSTLGKALRMCVCVGTVPQGLHPMEAKNKAGSTDPLTAVVGGSCDRDVGDFVGDSVVHLDAVSLVCLHAFTARHTGTSTGLPVGPVGAIGAGGCHSATGVEARWGHCRAAFSCQQQQWKVSYHILSQEVHSYHTSDRKDVNTDYPQEENSCS